MVDDDRIQIKKNEKIIKVSARFRTLGCYPYLSNTTWKQIHLVKLSKN